MDDRNEESQEALDESSSWFECDDGWGTLIAGLEAKLKAPSPDYTVSQVKEKFGGLRYYANPGDVDQETSERFYDLTARPRPSPTRPASAVGSLAGSRGEARAAGTRRSAPPTP